MGFGVSETTELDFSVGETSEEDFAQPQNIKDELR